MDNVLTVQVLESLHDLDRIDAHQGLIKVAKSVKDLPQGATADHLKDQINLVLTVPLEVVILDNVWMLQDLQQIDFIFNGVQLGAPLLRICLCRQSDTLDGEKTTCLQVECRVDLAKGTLSDQIVLLIVHEGLLAARDQTLIQIVADRGYS